MVVDDRMSMQARDGHASPPSEEREPADWPEGPNAQVERLIRENPNLHAWSNGTPANWSVSGEVLRYLQRHLRPGMNTLETGAGQTTVLFAIVDTRHTCITPDPREGERIRSYCQRLGVSASSLSFIHQSSDVALARDDGLPESLDFVFLDGAHRFPFPCIDWHYTAKRLRVGGLVGVDDYTMPSVRVLHDFLNGEDEWELVEIVGRTSFFRHLRETLVVNDCHGQRMNRVLY